MANLKFVAGTVASGKTMDLIISANQLKEIHGQERILLLKPAIDTRYGNNIIKSAAGPSIKTDIIVGKHEKYEHDIYYCSCTNDYNKKCPVCLKEPTTALDEIVDLNRIDAIIVDEVQFLSESCIEFLRFNSVALNIDVHCYGLLKDFKGNMFESSKYLLTVCDEIVIKEAYCKLCNINISKIDDDSNSCIIRYVPISDHTYSTSKAKRNVRLPNKATCNLKIFKNNEGEISAVTEGDSICIGGIETYIPVCYKCYFKMTNTD